MQWQPLSNIEILKRLEIPAADSGKVLDMVLDTDTYNEVDDQFALCYALCSPERLNVQAVYAAPFFNDRSNGPEQGMERSYDEIVRLLGKMGHRRPLYIRGGGCGRSCARFRVAGLRPAGLQSASRAQRPSPYALPYRARACPARVQPRPRHSMRGRTRPRYCPPFQAYLRLPTAFAFRICFSFAIDSLLCAYSRFNLRVRV